MNSTSDPFRGLLAEPFVSDSPDNSGASAALARPNWPTKIVATCVLGLTLSGCVGANVNNSLDVAALEAPQSLTPSTLDEAALASENEVALAGNVPIPARSPIATQTSQTALVADQPENQAVAATQQALATQPTDAPASAASTNSAPASKPETIQTAALETETSAQTGSTTVVRPVVPQQATVAPQKPKKSGGLLGFLFGRKPAASQTAAAKPKSKTTVTSAPTQEALNGALPGVKRNSAIFGINDADESADTNVQVASVGAGGRLLSPAGLILQTERVQVSCFKPELMRILASVQRKYGKRVMVTSGYRSPNGNRRAGGARNSTHIYCKAADIQVEGVSKWDLAKYLRTVPGRGGVGTYCRTKSVHIDVGTQRDWHHPCRRSKKRKKA